MKPMIDDIVRDAVMRALRMPGFEGDLLGAGQVYTAVATQQITDSTLRIKIASRNGPIHNFEVQVRTLPVSGIGASTAEMGR